MCRKCLSSPRCRSGLIDSAWASSLDKNVSIKKIYIYHECKLHSGACNIIHSSYVRGVQGPVVYNFFPNAPPGQKILEAPNNLIYLPVTSVANGSTRKGAESTWRGIDN